MPNHNGIFLKKYFNLFILAHFGKKTNKDFCLFKKEKICIINFEDIAVQYVPWWNAASEYRILQYGTTAT